MDNIQTVKIAVATHKVYRMPRDGIYMPLQVGAALKQENSENTLQLGYCQDNTGDNISIKNQSYCELTGLYWAWKNLDAAYLGLVHYRRHFALHKKSKIPFDNILNKTEVEELVRHYKVIVPQKRKYYIETLYSHYAHSHYAKHLDMTREIIQQTNPEYMAAFDHVMKQRSGYMFNMMIMERKLLDHYCEWLFAILEELEQKTATIELSFYQGRFYGRVSEILFNVWLRYQTQQGFLHKRDIKEIPCVYMESIDWKRKIASFLKAKFMHKKYEKSF